MLLLGVGCGPIAGRLLVLVKCSHDCDKGTTAGGLGARTREGGGTGAAALGTRVRVEEEGDEDEQCGLGREGA
jgi:hypothetical protein